MDADAAPGFGDAAILDQTYRQNTAIAPLTLPEASGGNGELTYTLTPTPPAGLTFDAATRTLSGTPGAAVAATTHTYAATDTDGDEATLTFTVTVDADTAPDFGGSTITDLSLTRGEAMAPLTLPVAVGGEGVLTYALSPALPSGLSFDAATRILSGTPTQPVGARNYEYTATDEDLSEPDVASLTFTIEVVSSPKDGQVLSDALAAQGRALLAGATSVIGERFRTPPPAASPGRDGGHAKPTEQAMNFVADWLTSGAGGVSADTDMVGPASVRRGPLPTPRMGAAFDGPSALGRVPAHRRTAVNRKLGRDMEQLIQGRSFALALPVSGELESDGGIPRWTLWGAADVQRFDATSGPAGFNGGISSLYLGADTRFGGGDWLAGAALSRSAGDSDYSMNGHTGKFDTELTALHPYIRGETGSGMELWAMGGIGSGEVEDRSDVLGAGAERADLDMTMAAVGVRQPLAQRGALEFSLVGAAGFVSLSTDGGDGLRLVDGLDTSVTQARFALEMSLPSESLAPYARIGARADGGDGVTGTGLEVLGGLRYSGARVDFETQGRWLAAYSEEDYEEYGGMARVTFKAHEDGSGLRLTLAPSWGRAAGDAMFGSGDGLLGGPGMDSMRPTGGAAMPPGSYEVPMALEGGIGYGFAFERGLLTFNATHNRDAWTVRETFGLSWESAGADAMRLESAPQVGGKLKLLLGYERSYTMPQGAPRFELIYIARF